MTSSMGDTALLASARLRGVHRIVVPSPFRGLGVNVYLLEGGSPTLVDTGPNQGTAFGTLESGLHAIGYAVKDIRMILLTHHHMDHVGLAGLVAERAGAEVVSLDMTADYIADYEVSSEADEEVREQTMVEHGVEAELAAALRAASATIHGFGASCAVGRRVTSGEVVELGGSRLRALHRPGHSATDTLWIDEERRLVFAGDHLLAGVSANAIVDRTHDPAGDGGRARSLLAYRRSLLQTRLLDAEVVLAGHGRAIADHRMLVDQRLSQQDDRAQALLALLGSEPRTARELSLELLGDRARMHVFLALSEVLGHLDMLVEDGRAQEVAVGGGRRAYMRGIGAEAA